MRFEDCLTPLRREDSLECRLSGARDDAEALHYALMHSTIALTVLQDGRPVAFAGIVDESPKPETERLGCVWLLTSEDARRQPVAFHRLAIRFLTVCRWDVLRNHVDANYKTALRWLSALGFKVSTPSPWGPYGAPFCAVEWRREWTHSPS